MSDLVLRFLIGGVFVSFFALLGDILHPKSFAGLFSAAPSIALATLSLTVARKGHLYAAIECRSMIAGAIAFVLYAVVVRRVLIGRRISALTATLSLLPIWIAVAFGLWSLSLR
jgi:hypothetical protein